MYGLEVTLFCVESTLTSEPPLFMQPCLHL